MKETKNITFGERKRLARELVLGAPVAGLVWLLLLKLFLGEWSFAFPGAIVLFSFVLALLMTGPAPVGTLAFRFWKGLVFCIDWLVTRIVCLLLYFLLITPVGLMVRLLRGTKASGRSPSSNWQKVSPAAGDRRHYFRQY
jgi:hypothetical protein